ncbi:hypothetical protein M2401_006362 [Pseudomonas sp. JUb42]|uniref:TylF/MycF family methyltransferase n=1 Tax=Pseudomonas sp. JUb42 TaxID=2940611 RepID=UPI0021685C60|nr:TylF/MycF family methyltransferase [Pseudomonas sp. JUb42]MCS3472597.1 hypothetical protein [Pseudomonas sp. JUb42]
MSKPITYREPKNQSLQDLEQFSASEILFKNSNDPLSIKLDSFAKYASRQSIAKFITKYELFKKIINVNGSIVEGGVLQGGGTLAWAKLSSILEPVNHTRKIIGFDTFDGFPSIDTKDTTGSDSDLLVPGALRGSSYEDVLAAVDTYDINRPLSHIQKIELIKGDISHTAKAYLDQNPHLVVSLLYLDVDLYQPTKTLIETFLPRMPKGAIIVFDELNAKSFPGETLAVQETLGINNLKIERFYFDSYISFAVL